MPHHATNNSYYEIMLHMKCEEKLFIVDGRIGVVCFGCCLLYEEVCYLRAMILTHINRNTEQASYVF